MPMEVFDCKFPATLWLHLTGISPPITAFEGISPRFEILLSLTRLQLEAPENLLDMIRCVVPKDVKIEAVAYAFESKIAIVVVPNWITRSDNLNRANCLQTRVQPFAKAGF